MKNFFTEFAAARAKHTFARKLYRMKTLSFLLAALLCICPPVCGTRPAAAAPAARTDAGERVIYLTFDDGPTDSTTPKALDILREFGVKATFFVIGRQIRGREEILRRTAAEGHAIGIHTYTHDYAAIYRSREALLEDIGRCRDAIRAALPGYDRNIYRFPGGSFLCPELRDAVRKAGYRYYDWNASAGDAEGNYSAEQLFENAVRSAQNKDPVLLLLHDGVGYRQTLRALPKIIGYFQNEGYRFKTP